MKKAIDMTVDEFEAHLKWKRQALFDSVIRFDVNERWRRNSWRSSIMGKKGAEKGGTAPFIAMHTRRAMQRRRTP